MFPAITNPLIRLLVEILDDLPGDNNEVEHSSSPLWRLAVRELNSVAPLEEPGDLTHGERLERYEAWLRHACIHAHLGTGDQPARFMDVMDKLHQEGFLDVLLRAIWRECPDEAKQLG